MGPGTGLFIVIYNIACKLNNYTVKLSFFVTLEESTVIHIDSFEQRLQGSEGWTALSKVTQLDLSRVRCSDSWSRGVPPTPVTWTVGIETGGVSIYYWSHSLFSIVFLGAFLIQDTLSVDVERSSDFLVSLCKTQLLSFSLSFFVHDSNRYL